MPEVAEISTLQEEKSPPSVERVLDDGKEQRKERLRKRLITIGWFTTVAGLITEITGLFTNSVVRLTGVFTLLTGGLLRTVPWLQQRIKDENQKKSNG